MKHIDEDSKTNSIAKFRIGETVRICGPKTLYGDNVGNSVVITKCVNRGNSFAYAVVGIGWTAWHEEKNLESDDLLSKIEALPRWSCYDDRETQTGDYLYRDDVINLLK